MAVRMAGFVVGQPTREKVWVFTIGYFSHEGWFVHWGEPAKRYGLTSSRSTYESNYGNRLGQGGRLSRSLDPAKTDPSVFRYPLTGGFLCEADGEVAALDCRCDFKMNTPFVLPFVLSEKYEQQFHEEGRSGSVEVYRETRLELGVWYPVEIRRGDEEQRYYGVINFDELAPDGSGTGRLRYVHDSLQGPLGVTEVTLERYGRSVGRAFDIRES